MYRGCTWPPLATHTCSSWFMWQAEALSTEGEGAQAERLRTKGCPHARGDTLPRHMQRGQKEGSQAHEEEAYAVKSQEDRHKQEEDRDGKSLRGDRA